MSELYKCVITPNVRTIDLKSIQCELRPGLHWILEDGKPPRVLIPPGRQCIESFTLGPDGARIVNETLIAGVGLIRGALPAPLPNGMIDLVLAPEIVISLESEEQT
jgi:hypothetical protein